MGGGGREVIERKICKMYERRCTGVYYSSLNTIKFYFVLVFLLYCMIMVITDCKQRLMSTMVKWLN